MPNTVLLKKSSVANSVPTTGDLQPGELALNYTDGNLFYKNASNVVTVIASNKSISLSGNITGGNISATSHTGSVVSVTGNVTGGNILTGGLISATSTITSAANITGGNLTTTGKGNIGELFVTTSAGNEGGQINLPLAAANTTLSGSVVIDVFQNRLRFYEGGGTARGAYIDLTAAGAGVSTNLLAGGGGTPGGANTQVQFNDGGTFGGNGQFVYNKTTNIVTAGAFAGNTNGTGQNFQVGDDAWIGDINTADTIGIKGQQNAGNGFIVFGNADATGKLGRAGTGPLTYAGAFSASGNVTGGNITTAGLITSTGNITGGNLLTGGLISATSTITSAANITGGNLATGGTASATGNITGGNILTGGLISATGNITGGNANIGGNLNVTSSLTVSSNGTYGNVVTTPFASVYATGAGANPYSIMQVRSNDGISGMGMQAYANLNGLLYSNTGITFQTGATVRDKDYPTGGVSRVIIDSTGLTANGIVSASGNVTGGNIATGGLITSTGNVTGGNLITAGIVTATGNISGNYFIGNGSLLTGISGGGNTAGGYFNSTLTTYPTGDYGNGEAYCGASPSTDVFNIIILPNFDDIDPQGSYVTVDLN